MNIIRMLTEGVVVEFAPPITCEAHFTDSNFTFNNVVRAKKNENGVVFLEMENKGFVEIHPPYRILYIRSGQGDE